MTHTDQYPHHAGRGARHISHRVKRLARRVARALRHAARTVAATIAECTWAQRRLTELWLSPERHLDNAHEAPDTYAEFLFRSSGQLIHEPPAHKRFVSPGRRR